jgi:hypothetical protein
MDQIFLHRSPTLNRAVHFKMAATELMRLGIGVVCDYSINQCRKII